MTRHTLVACGVAAALVLPAALAPALEISWHSFDAGGGRSEAANLALFGTIGQPDAGTLGGGTYELRGGFLGSAGDAATDSPEDVPVIAPKAHGLGLAAPNPFVADTSLRFEIARPAHARLRVYDVSGRLVRTLVDERLEAGRHTANWDGRDESGRRVASGVFFVRMQAENFGAVRKITRLD
ncbi:MAG: T9SS type A sorting domain-containing protein [Gemmatimonadetes bacterium]|nr:T9SS type A sorting domain-containing protein [Gemmatimonadota bacterium]